MARYRESIVLGRRGTRRDLPFQWWAGDEVSAPFGIPTTWRATGLVRERLGARAACPTHTHTCALTVLCAVHPWRHLCLAPHFVCLAPHFVCLCHSARVAMHATLLKHLDPVGYAIPDDRCHPPLCLSHAIWGALRHIWRLCRKWPDKNLTYKTCCVL